jgi:hypothetical protein
LFCLFTFFGKGTVRIDTALVFELFLVIVVCSFASFLLSQAELGIEEKNRYCLGFFYGSDIACQCSVALFFLLEVRFCQLLSCRPSCVSLLSLWYSSN